jgi:glycine/D-amino acid oxidase-like deaminating enzyme
MRPYDVTVIGGGFYGCALALFACERVERVALIEKEPDLLTRASYANQARVHHGYHYPRSLMTALRSSVNFPRFALEFRDCLDDAFEMVYAIARDSKVTAEQFLGICERIQAPAKPAPARYAGLFDPAAVEQAFLVKEVAFDAVKLRERLKQQLDAAGVDVFYEACVDRVAPCEEGHGLDVVLAGAAPRLCSRDVMNCAYSQINTILHRSGLPLLPFKHEISELPLVEVPPALQAVGVTVMDGPYFSAMPFPPRRLHSLHHVRYSPHESWQDPEAYRDAHEALAARRRPSNFDFMVRDASRYLPVFRQSRQAGSLFEVKTILPRNEVDDGRPILFRPHHGLEGLSIVLGAKIDNIYDAFEAWRQLNAHWTTRRAEQPAQKETARE